ncbi:MAG: homoaconitase [Planctomycetes bacterium]|nr:homoaconitase [Planctomycetota bacterium]
MAQTIVEKIAAAHAASDPGLGRPLRAGDFVSIRPTHVMTHDNTAAVIPKFRAIGAHALADPRQPIFALDHDIQNHTDKNLEKYEAIATFARENGILAYAAGAGIGHQLMVEQGHVLPGTFVVASDSHSNMYGALGAVGTPVVRTDAAAIWAIGEFWWQIPRTIRVVLTGQLRPGVYGKDVILTLCGLYDHDEVLNASLEFDGPGVTELDLDARLSIANMSTEWGALSAWFPVDATTVRWLRRRREALVANGIDRIRPDDLERWAAEPPAPDPGAFYAGTITLDLGDVAPRVAGPDTVQVTAPLTTIEARRIAIDKAYIVSCVNSRQSDLEVAARVLAGRHVAPGVKLYVAAASQEVQSRAEESGAWQDLLAAGAHTLPPGCGPCIGLGTGLLEAGEVGISATNRNFKGRMGSRDAQCYLASPEVVAESAAAGYIRGPRAITPGPLTARFARHAAPRRGDDPAVAILPGFPAELTGRLVYLPQDNLNTDGIYGKDYTYREDMTPAEMARVVMENYDPTFGAKVASGDVLVAGHNFGTGSSREQAATALIHKGIPLVVAASFSQTYLRNAFNNGFLCIENEELPAALAEAFAADVEAGTRTICTGDLLHVDFRRGRISFRGVNYSFPALGSVPQSLVVAGGIEPLVRSRLTTAC